MRKTASQSRVPSVELTGEAIGKGPAHHADSRPAKWLGTFRVLFGELPEGRYRAASPAASRPDSGSETVFDVRSLMEEQLDLRARPDLMARIAASTGGSSSPPTPRPRSPGPSPPTSTKARWTGSARPPAWDRWWVLVGAFAAAWVTTWGVRRNSGLV